MAAYGFVSGLPLPLSGFTFRLWLSDSGAGLAVVGLTAWIGLAYSLKFLWAPLLDQTPPLRALRRFGRRRGWLLLVQPLLGLAAMLLALSDPAAAPMAAFAAAACVAVLSATQDIAIDAWRIEIFPARRQGWRWRPMSGAIGWRCWYRRRGRSRRRSASAGTGRCWGWRSLIACRKPGDPGGHARSRRASAAIRGLRQAVIEPVRRFWSGRRRCWCWRSSRCSSWARRWPGS